MKFSSDKVKEWRKATKARILEAMGGKCVICGYNKCYRAMVLHHINPEEKDFSFGKIRASPKNWKIICDELRKCVLLCANCHSEIHDGIIELPENYNKFNEEFVNYKFLKRTTDDSICPICKGPKEEFNSTCSNKCALTKANIVASGKMYLEKCIDCNTKISKRSIRCRKCFTIANTSKRLKIQWPEYSVLKQMVLEYGYSKTGRILGVSDNAVRRHIKKAPGI